MCGLLSPQWASAETPLASVPSGTVFLPLAAMTGRCISAPLKLTTRKRTSGRRCVHRCNPSKSVSLFSVRSFSPPPLPGFLPCFRCYANALWPLQRYGKEETKWNGLIHQYAENVPVAHPLQVPGDFQMGIFFYIYRVLGMQIERVTEGDEI